MPDIYLANLAPPRRLRADRRVAGLLMIVDSPEVEEMHFVDLETLRTATRGEVSIDGGASTRFTVTNSHRGGPLQ